MNKSLYLSDLGFITEKMVINLTQNYVAEKGYGSAYFIVSNSYNIHLQHCIYFTYTVS